MEFGEKLQELRKNRGLTQEELAESLYVSRTAISKWESGRGYPSIDSLKEISKYFSVTIDELLSGEKLISIAETEKKTAVQKLCRMILGIVDVFSFMLIILPLYPKPLDGYIYSVNLFDYTDTTSFNKTVYWILFIGLMLIGVVQIILTQYKLEKVQKYVIVLSIIINIFTVLFLAMTRESYAIAVSFMLLVVKAIILYRYGNSI